jgi:fructose-1,6-bisphosphatase/sedoheptulose 1,7-bisphosphatase-like protein
VEDCAIVMELVEGGALAGPLPIRDGARLPRQIAEALEAAHDKGVTPEGVLTAAALRCLNGEILGRLVVKDDAQKERMQEMGIRDVNRIYTTPELAPGRNLVFAACGVTDGNLLQGVRFTGDGTHAVHRHDVYSRARAIHRHHPPGEQARREGAVPVGCYWV